jgi:hypothetical protein
MKCRKAYKDDEKFKVYRNAYKAKYDKKTSYFTAESHGRHYTFEEQNMIMRHDMSDREIAKYLNRSVNSIQRARWTIKKRRERMASAYDESRGV